MDYVFGIAEGLIYVRQSDLMLRNFMLKLGLGALMRWIVFVG